MPNEGRPIIQALPLGPSEPGVRPLPISTDAPRTLGLRRIHIVNRGAATFLWHWEVWTAVPGRDTLARARVIARREWADMCRGLARGAGAPVLCEGDVVQAPRNTRILRDIPFLVEGLLPDDVSLGIVVQVRFVDRANRRWIYGGDSRGDETLSSIDSNVA